uniref:Uncharacterized protein n=1 Tax=Mandrillus leucophaeus TaxID=9568 RepID=A0A2K5ZNM1_MANLE
RRGWGRSGSGRAGGSIFFPFLWRAGLSAGRELRCVGRTAYLLGARGRSLFLLDSGALLTDRITWCLGRI